MRFRRHFFRHTDFLRFKISRKFLFLNLDFGYHGKMYRLVPCIPILRGFFVKSAKKICICDYVKITLVLVKNVFLGLKKSISGIVS